MPDNAETRTQGYNDLLRAVVNGDVLFLDDPYGAMVGFVFRDCAQHLTESLNAGIDPDADPGHAGGPWLCHDYLDWVSPDRCAQWLNRPGGSHAPGGNLMTLLKAVADGRLNGIVDRSGRRIGYLFHDREDCQNIIHRALGFHGNSDE